jgi:hypothetical protein
MFAVFGNPYPATMSVRPIHFKLRVNEEGAEATVKVYLSEPVPAGSKWYKFDPIADTWTDYSEYAILSSDRKSVTLTIVDGGFGDLDGIANGIIIDPSGLGAANASTGDGDDISGGVDNLVDNAADEFLDGAIDNLSSKAGCFINTAAHRQADMQLLDFSSGGRSPQWAILILLLGSLIICFKKRGLK